MELFPYQAALVAEIGALLASSVSRVLLQAATGAGKTVIAAELIKRAVAVRQPVVFIADRLELITQASKKLLRFDIDHGIIKAGFDMHLGKKVQVASVQTLFARAVRNKKIDLPRADWVFIDEAHHVRAMTYMAIVKAYSAARIIGLTATPCRLDGRGLGNVFQALVQCPEVAELTRLGFLVPAKVFAPVRLNLNGLKAANGDYVRSELADRVNTDALVGDIVEHWFRLGERRRTVVFAVNLGHGQHITWEFRKADVAVEMLDGTTPTDERNRILADLAAGKLNIVVNCMVLTEGWDCPEASCAVLARPTKSLGLVGRILRPAPGKSDALVLYHAGGVFAHGLPDDPISWVLESDGKAENTVHASRGATPHAPALTTCPRCSAVRLEGRPCPVCGWRPMRAPRPVDVADGELGQVMRDGVARASEWSECEKLTFYRQLMGVATQRGYKSAWAAHKYAERFGGFPPWSWNRQGPLPPSGAVSAWVRARNLAYATSLPR